MANFSYEAYKARVEAKKKTQPNRFNNNQTTRKPIHFLGEWLKKDGDSVIIRFPYHTMNDIDTFVDTHLATFPGDRFAKRVACGGDNCPLCAQGVKLNTRVIIKAVAYIPNSETGRVELVAAIWDRPAMFADTDIKEKMEEYGDLSKCLFKLKRFGEGTSTRYELNIVTNTVVYKPEIYVEDFSCLDGIDPIRVTVRPLERFLTAISEAEEESASASNSNTMEAKDVDKDGFVSDPMIKAETFEDEPAAPQPTVVKEERKVVVGEPKEEAPQPRVRRYTF